MKSAVQVIEKPWGSETIYALTSRYCGKIIRVRRGECLSLQYHRTKDETLFLIEGQAVLEIGPSVDAMESINLESGFSVRIPPGTRHRLRAIEDTTMLEASTPELDDVVRLDDRYGRASS